MLLFTICCSSATYAYLDSPELIVFPGGYIPMLLVDFLGYNNHAYVLVIYEIFSIVWLGFVSTVAAVLIGSSLFCLSSS